MSERLLIHLARDGALRWRRAGDARALPAGGDGSPPEAVLAAAEDVVVLVPAEDVLLTEAKIGARNRAQLLQAVPFAVEEQLLGNVEDLHFAAAASASGQTGIAVVTRERMRGWLDRLSAEGIRPDRLLPESLAVPPGSVLVEGDRAIARLGPWSAFASPRQDLADWLAETNEVMVPELVETLPTTPACTLSESSKAATEFCQRVWAAATRALFDADVGAAP